MTLRIGVDTGGTFTDVVAYDTETDTVHVAKTPSTPPQFETGVVTGIEAAIGASDATPAAVSFLSHGTTVGTNAVLEEELPELGLITNAGLRDVLAIGDQTRPELYNLQTEKPPSLIPRRHRLGVPGRIDATGSVVDELDESAVRSAVRELAAADVDAIVVAMVFSYLNDSHEQRVGELIEAETDCQYALSSAVYPERREYDRTVTTVLNEAVKLTIEEYLTTLTEETAGRGIEAPINVMHSGGGIFGTEQATEFALRTVLSGPAAGAVACQELSDAEDVSNAIGLDMGGTSADVSIIEDGALVRSTEGEINNLPINTPVVDITTVGAGGGSIAWVDAAGGLRVGPRSAGADPGPVCYGRGGTEPTVTDANLVLGRIDPTAFIDGDAQSAINKAHERFERTVAEPLGLSPTAAAVDVLRVANAKMARAIRRVTVERGQDPGAYSLVAFGGAGPLHAVAIARRTGMDAVLLPRAPGVFSARGLLVADVRMDESAAYTGSTPDPTRVGDQLAALEATLTDRFADQGFDPERISVSRQLDLRYAGQAYELTVTLPGDEYAADSDQFAAGLERFHRRHEQRYGYATREEPVELVTCRVAGTVATEPVDDTADTDTARAAPDDRSRAVHFETGGTQTTPVRRRDTVGPDETIVGPAVLEGSGSTTVVPPDVTATVSGGGTLRIELQ